MRSASTARNSVHGTGSHLFIGDGHFIGAQEEEQKLKALVDSCLRAHVSEVSILGDLFELWIGLAQCDPPGIDTIIQQLQRLKEKGVRLRYVCGNKDYFIHDWNERHGIFYEVIDNDCRLPVCAGKDPTPTELVLAHGDLVNRADRQYQLWRAVSRCGPFRLLMRLLPRTILARLAKKTAQAMTTTNRYHKSYFPEALLHSHARQHKNPTQFTTFIFGHFHEHHHIEEQEAKYRIITLPFLGNDYTGVLLEAGEFRLFPHAIAPR